MARYGPLERIAYTGDGTNDFCPGTRLRQHDMYFLREGKSLDAYLKTDPKLETKLICQKTRWIEPSTVWKHMPVFFS
jgi:pyridoxal phosphate phosphatase PHOSPHO2